jgi:hypothetical protein
VLLELLLLLLNAGNCHRGKGHFSCWCSWSKERGRGDRDLKRAATLSRDFLASCEDSFVSCQLTL